MHRTHSLTRALLTTTLLATMLLGCDGSVALSDPDASVTLDLRRRGAMFVPGPRRDGGPTEAISDAGSMLASDAGAAPTDAGTSERDAGTTGASDAGTRAPLDAATVARDAGTTVARDAGTTVARDAGTSTLDAGAPRGDRPYELGAWPDPAMMVAWPTAPRTTREVRVSTLAAANTAAAVAGTRVIVSGALGGTLTIAASDVDVVFEPGASAGAVFIANRLARVAVHGGRVDHVEMQLPATFWPTETWNRDWMTTDVLVDGIEADAADTAFLMRSGIRIAITNSRAHAVRYGVWFGDTADFQSEDIIIAGNEITCDGPEATVRLVNTLRSATIGNRLQNGAKHNYRIHGRSDLNWAARNVLVDTGVMIGTMEGDVVGREWFDDNVFYHRAPSLFQVDSPRVSRLVARGNDIHTDVWDCFLCVTPASGWVLTDNVVGPYVAPAE